MIVNELAMSKSKFCARHMAQKSLTLLQRRRISKQRKQAGHDRPQTDQHDQQFEKLRQPRVGTEFIDDPKQDRTDDDNNQDSNYEREHGDLPSL
jgi:hypothetical protein